MMLFFTGRKKRQCHQVRAGLYRSDVPSDGARRPFPESGHFFHWGENDESLLSARGRGRRPCGDGGRDGTLRRPGGIRREGSSYHLAEVTKTPVILVVNAHGMGRSIPAGHMGLSDHDRHHLIRGVILNQTSVTFCETIRPEIERELSLPVLGVSAEVKGTALGQQTFRTCDARRDCGCEKADPDGGGYARKNA